jgi:multidrug efflux system outer membrane protein
MNNSTRNNGLALSLMTAVLASLGGCFSLAPEYTGAPSNSPDQFKEAGTHSETTDDSETLWKTAAPSDQLGRGTWWKVFADPVLDGLELQATTQNQNLKAAFARIQQSRAYLQSAEATKLPSVDVGFGPSREQDSQSTTGDGSVSTYWRAQTRVAYEVDLFDRVSDSVKAVTADTQRKEALYQSLMLALQAEVADTYFQIRTLDAQVTTFTTTVGLRTKALDFIQARKSAGQASEQVLQRAKAQLASARSGMLTVVRNRAQAEHALAILVGEAPTNFNLAAESIQPIEFQVPAGIPSTLLERRPDIAGAERAMAAANARIGVARSAFFPSISLTGTAGWEGSNLGNLFQGSSKAFLFGPLTGTMVNLPIFDGGRRKADLASAREAYQEQTANYQQTVLNALREVEDTLSDTRILTTQINEQDAAVAYSLRASELTRIQYREGALDYLQVIDAERTALGAQLRQQQLYGAQAQATVNLIRALGGSWGGSGNRVDIPTDSSTRG